MSFGSRSSFLNDPLEGVHKGTVCERTTNVVFEIETSVLSAEALGQTLPWARKLLRSFVTNFRGMDFCF